MEPRHYPRQSFPSQYSHSCTQRSRKYRSRALYKRRMHPQHWQGSPFGWIHLALVHHPRGSLSIHAPSGSEPQGAIYITMNGPKPFLKPPTHTHNLLTKLHFIFISIYRIPNRQSPHTDYRLPHTDYRLPLTAYRLLPTDYRLPHTAYRLPLTDYRLPITDYRLPITALPSTDY